MNTLYQDEDDVDEVEIDLTNLDPNTLCDNHHQQMHLHHHHSNNNNNSNNNHHESFFSSRLTDLTNVLQDTNRNLRDIDFKIDQHSRSIQQNQHQHRKMKNSSSRNGRCFSQANQYHHSADRYNKRTINKYDVRSSHSDYEDEHLIESAGGGGDGDDGVGRCFKRNSKCKIKTINSSASRRNSRGRSSYMRDDLNESLHELHKRVRDISFEQEKLAEELKMQREREDYSAERDAHASKSKKSSSKKHSDKHKSSSSTDSDTSLEKRIEKRMNSVYAKLEKQRLSKNINCDNSNNALQNELKSILEEIRKVKKEDINSHLYIQDSENKKTYNDLLDAKRKLKDLEESKEDLAVQVKNLKDQLNLFQSNNAKNNNAQNQPYQNMCGCNSNNNTNNNTDGLYWNNNNNSHSQPNRFLPQQQQIPPPDYINDQFKLIIKEKDAREAQLQAEIKLLQEKLDQCEKEREKYKAETEQTEMKLQEVLIHSENCAGYLQSCEEQLDLSEKKRDELKYEAQETIKLWKNKVKKLEKNIERIKSESAGHTQQIEILKKNEGNLNIQLDTKSNELSILKNVNNNLEDKIKLQDMEINHMKQLCDELKSEISTLKNQPYYNSVSNASSTRNYEIHSDDHQKTNIASASESNVDESKYKAYHQNRIIELQSELEIMKNERKEFESYIIKLETDYQKLKVTLDNVEQETKPDGVNFSKQNKENLEEVILKYSAQLQQTQYQLQRSRIEYEDKIRMLHAQLIEETSNLEIMKKRELQYIYEADELKSAKRKLDDELVECKCKLEKNSKIENEKNKTIIELEDKYNRALSEFAQQNNHYLNKESEYLKMLNSIDTDIDLINGVIQSNTNETYKPILNLEESDKSNYLYLLIKHKIHWFGKSLEDLFQREYKLKQNIQFLEHEIETSKKNNVSNLKNQSIFMKSLQNQNKELITERALAIKNMELLEKYLKSLTESIKNHSNKEIERTHHLFAIDNMQSLYGNINLSQAERNEIYERFKQYKNTVNDIKLQLDKSWPKVENMSNKDSHKPTNGCYRYETRIKTSKSSNKQKPFKC